MEKQKEWKKVESQVFRFEKVGDSIEGILKAKEEGAVYGNEVYQIETSDGDTFAVFSTAILASRMAQVDVGEEVKIVFKGKEPSKKAGYEAMQLFDVFHR